MINELETLEERIQQQDGVIKYQGDYIDKLVINRDKVRGLLREYDRGELSAELLVSYLKVYVRYNGN